MKPADDLTTEQLVGHHVAFKEGADHSSCWHAKAGLRSGVVLRLVPSLSQKAELLATEGIPLPEGLPLEEEPRFWVRADPCSAFPRGCELAAEKECLLLLEP
ncbi:MAG: hypothetical protein JO112_20635 [Planctomycetes bacterium]|nr:hypothetical protein [Planctomycetota bacterium]